MNRLFPLLCGLLFGAGLAASGMTNTHKVLAFLDITGAWEPDLLFVMVSALALTIVLFPLVLKRKHPLFSREFYLPGNIHIDARLLLGALLFGIGWGLYGYCPGPAIATVIYGQVDTLIFIVSMSVGMWLCHAMDKYKAALSSQNA